MPSLPHPIYGTCTKADSSAYTGRVWLTNENINQTIIVTCNSLGQYVFDLANMNSYTSGDILLIAIEAYGEPGYLLIKDSFEDTSVDSIEAAGKRLNTAELTMNFKVGFGVSLNKARVEVFKKIWNILEKDPPTYIGKGATTKTYNILASFPNVTPSFPCIVINSIIQDTNRLGVGKRANRSLPCSITFEFYAKTSDEKGAIDIGRGKVQTVLENNWVTESLTVEGEAGQMQNIEGVE